MKKLLVPLILFAIAAVAATAMWQWTAPAKEDLGEAAIGGPFALINQDGKPVTDKTYSGKLMLVYFGYSFCPDICPTDLSIMSQAVNLLGADAAKVTPIFITIDPERDTPAHLKNYLASFKPAIEGLSGDKISTEAVIKSYKVYAQKVGNKDPKNYLMDHSAFMYLMGGDGKYLAHFAHNTPPAQIAAEIRKHL